MAMALLNWFFNCFGVKKKISKILKNTSKTHKKHIGTCFGHFWEKRFCSDFLDFRPGTGHQKHEILYLLERQRPF
jgi:hypothetical protein